MKHDLLAVLVLCSACSSAKVAGGGAVQVGDEPAGVLLGTWYPSTCRDARGDPVALRGAIVRLVRQSDGRVVLVEMRPAYDSLVVTNSFVRGQELVFQLALKSSSSAPYLREYRLPAGGAGAGRFLVVSRDWDARETEHGFTAWYRRPAVDCALVPRSGA